MSVHVCGGVMCVTVHVCGGMMCVSACVWWCDVCRVGGVTTSGQ